MTRLTGKVAVLNGQVTGIGRVSRVRGVFLDDRNNDTLGRWTPGVLKGQRQKCHAN